MFGRFTKRAAEWTVGEVLRTLVLPWLVPIGVGVMGWLEGESLFYLSVGVLLAGAAVTTWLVRVQEWSALNRVEHKLLFRSAKIHLTQYEDTVVAVRFGFDLLNNAAFPIKFRVDDLKTSLKIAGSDRPPLYPPKRDYATNVVATAPGAIGWFFDHHIALPKGFKGDVIAELHCDISYGKADRFDHKLDLRKNTHIAFDGSTVISGGQHWNDH